MAGGRREVRIHALHDGLEVVAVVPTTLDAGQMVRGLRAGAVVERAGLQMGGHRGMFGKTPLVYRGERCTEDPALKQKETVTHDCHIKFACDVGKK